MIYPGTLDLTALRHVPFIVQIEFRGYILNGASYDFAVKLRRGAPDPAIVSLNAVLPGAEGVSSVLINDAGTWVTVVTIQIDEDTLDAILPPETSGRKADTDLDLHYDLIITDEVVGRHRWLEGKFIIREGVAT